MAIRRLLSGGWQQGVGRLGCVARESARLCLAGSTTQTGTQTNLMRRRGFERWQLPTRCSQVSATHSCLLPCRNRCCVSVMFLYWQLLERHRVMASCDAAACRCLLWSNDKQAFLGCSLSFSPAAYGLAGLLCRCRCPEEGGLRSVWRAGPEARPGRRRRRRTRRRPRRLPLPGVTAGRYSDGRGRWQRPRAS